jgi:hypothetical protein
MLLEKGIARPEFKRHKITLEISATESKQSESVLGEYREKSAGDDQ